MKNSIDVLLKKLKEVHLDALLVSSPHNITFLTGYESHDSYLLLSAREKSYLTDARYTGEAKKSLPDFTVREIKGGMTNTLVELSRSLQFRRIGFEEKHTSYAVYTHIRKALGKKVQLSEIPGWIEDLRQIKTAEELKKIKKAVRITILAFRYIKKFIKPGKKEIEIAGEIERFIRYNNASASSFDIIVAAGENSSFPHHKTSGRAIGRNEPVLIDMGVEYNGFKSDLTRVFFSGKIDTFGKKIYSIVREAQDKAVRTIRPGVCIGEIDAAARRYIAEQGYGNQFLHSLGHGIGLEVHEAPTISGKNKDTVRPGMVFTVEPGIYFSGDFGIRIEDMVAVTENGIEILSRDLPQ